MCKSSRQGGQRCAAHTRARYESVSFESPAWDKAASEYASTPEGEARLRQQLEFLARGNNQRAIGRVSSALRNGLTIREANKAAAVAIAAANPVPVAGRFDRAAVNEVVAQAQALNPDGWAVDPEDVMHAVDERYVETLAREGQDAALEVLREVWRYHRDAFVQSHERGAALPVQARSAGMMVAVEEFVARVRDRSLTENTVANTVRSVS